MSNELQNLTQIQKGVTFPESKEEKQTRRQKTLWAHCLLVQGFLLPTYGHISSNIHT